MNFRIKVESQGIAAKLRQLEKVSGIACEEGVKAIGLSTARALAMKVQPYGIKENAKHAKFLRSIRNQVERAWFGVNVGAFPATTDMRQAHYQARKNGVVPPRLFRRQRGNPWLDLIPLEERDRHADKQVKKAGRAKAAWIEAGNSLQAKSRSKAGGFQRISGVAGWISRHAGKGWGTSSLTGSSAKATATLHNRTPYISALQKNSQIKSALVSGRKNGINRINYIIKAELRKLERETAKSAARYAKFQGAAAKLHSRKLSI